MSSEVWSFLLFSDNDATRQGWMAYREDTHTHTYTLCVSCQCLSLLIGSILSHVFSSITGNRSHLLPFALSVKSLIPSIHLWERADPSPPPPPTTGPRLAPSSVFKPVTEATRSDNYSVDAALQQNGAGRDGRWMAIRKERREEPGRSWNERTEGYREVTRISEKRGSAG